MFDLERGVIVPAQAEVESEIFVQLPIVLREQPVVVVPQVNLVGLRRESASGRDREEAPVDGAESLEVPDGGEELFALAQRFDAVNFRSQEIPPELHLVVAEEFVGVGRE